MFGGHVIRKDGLPIALVNRYEVYFKVDDSNGADYEANGSEPFTYEAKRKSITISNWRSMNSKTPDRMSECVEKFYKVALKSKKERMWFSEAADRPMCCANRSELFLRRRSWDGLALLLFTDPIKQHTLARADVDAEPEYRKVRALNQMIDLAARFTVTVEKFSDGVRPMKNVPGKRLWRLRWIQVRPRSPAVSPIQSPDRRDRSGDWRRCFAERAYPLRSFSCFLVVDYSAPDVARPKLTPRTP
jgi:TfoX/Sxy family transcriptional regulator of competence genes